jgi:hypothetical protein
VREIGRKLREPLEADLDAREHRIQRVDQRLKFARYTPGRNARIEFAHRHMRGAAGNVAQRTQRRAHREIAECRCGKQRAQCREVERVAVAGEQRLAVAHLAPDHGMNDGAVTQCNIRGDSAHGQAIGAMPFLHVVLENQVRRFHFLQIANRKVRGIAFEQHVTVRVLHSQEEGLIADHKAVEPGLMKRNALRRIELACQAPQTLGRQHQVEIVLGANLLGQRAIQHATAHAKHQHGDQRKPGCQPRGQRESPHHASFTSST